MKILEKKPFLVFECVLCHSKLEAEVGDVKGFVDWEGDSSYWVECAVCGSKKYLSYKEVPPKAVKHS
ncbi:MAG: hypothetical protein A3D65_04255 [Candidatus Lloydbacteria bacterium RIFCSPHIGHO2_02_FULL_50_13]|uniref:Uncharacterized protein n=1 Tax=Candidatus Lloydbacteria bacterium RIFCSPHIGHO2_02_FULL_50_13 TaxID=1798661 RepID=A0A1G2D2L0_9BACT|nr:MAG: hypothetical protein A3D65_04255 [Candidatus Lloydbacteria bacterium RIFCSPHIGHO2_02_FULL_50_13]